tara:strand:+ start:67 stop:447 length:381 start_codon:yes stop_codon:yes gene_type:complete
MHIPILREIKEIITKELNIVKEGWNTASQVNSHFTNCDKTCHQLASGYKAKVARKLKKDKVSGCKWLKNQKNSHNKASKGGLGCPKKRRGCKAYVAKHEWKRVCKNLKPPKKKDGKLSDIKTKNEK